MANAVAALTFLLGVGAAQAEQVIFSGDNATEILDLQVGSTLYDVIFLYDKAENIYPTPLFDFDTSLKAEAAMEAVAAALNTEPDVMSVGPAHEISYLVPFNLGSIMGDPFVNSRMGYYFDLNSAVPPEWLRSSNPQERPLDTIQSYAAFTVVPEPAPSWLSGSAIAVFGVLARRRKTTAQSA
jgi:hypothetical protein